MTETEKTPDAPEDDDRVEPLPEDAEIEPPGPEDADESDEVLTPFPGFGDYNPIGGMSTVGAFEGTTPSDVLSGKRSGDVLLEVKGKRVDAGAFVRLIAFSTLLALAAVLWPQGIGDRPTTLTFLLVLGGAVVVGAWLLFDLVFRTDVEVTFTTEGVARHGKGADAWVPWSEVTGYRLEGALLTLECRRGSVPVPAPEERRPALVDLLEARGVRRS